MSGTYKISILPMNMTVIDEETGETRSSKQDDWYIFPDEVRESLTPILARHGYAQTLDEHPRGLVAGQDRGSMPRHVEEKTMGNCLLPGRIRDIRTHHIQAVRFQTLSKLPTTHRSDQERQDSIHQQELPLGWGCYGFSRNRR